MTGGLGLRAMGKGLAAWGGILRFAQNDRDSLGMTGGPGWRVGRVFGLWHVIMVGSGYRGWQGVSVIKLRGVLGMAGVFGFGVRAWLRG